VTIADAAHPNTVRITIELDGRKASMLGSSLGAGRILVQEIDGFPVEVTGNFHTIVLVAEDRKGSIARITGILAEHDINIATLKLTRKERGGDAFMVIECDEVPDKKAGEELRALDWVRWTRRLDKVSGG
jgi:L-serine dehydratase